jgi:hypothetical protein
LALPQDLRRRADSGSFLPTQIMLQAALAKDKRANKVSHRHSVLWSFIQERTMTAALSARVLQPSQSMRDSLLATIDMLDRRRASEIGDRLIDDYVSHDWLEWNGGALRLTVTGQNVRRQLLEQLEQPE